MEKTKTIEDLKIPVSLDDFKYRKSGQDWSITFVMESANLRLGKPLMDYIGQHFILCLIPVKNMENREIEQIEIDEDVL